MIGDLLATHGRPLVMGVVNTTPDSFSDGGLFLETSAAIDHAYRLLDEGADIVDIGGESSRPGSLPVDEVVECERVLPVASALARDGAVVSIDTRRSAVMRRAIDVGATIWNDITALDGAGSLDLAAATTVDLVLMHMRGTPQTMQHDPRYADPVAEVCDFLSRQAGKALARGVARERIVIDPGIGFGKTAAHNLALMAGLGTLAELGYPVLVGASRKSVIGALSRNEPPMQRLGGSIAAALYAVSRGARILRVHDAGETRQALAIWRALADQENLPPAERVA